MSFRKRIPSFYRTSKIEKLSSVGSTVSSTITLVSNPHMCSDMIDISGNNIGIIRISHLLTCHFSPGETLGERRLYPIEPSRVGIHRTHTCTHLIHLQAPSVHPVCQEPRPSTPGVTTCSPISHHPPFTPLQ